MNYGENDFFYYYWKPNWIATTYGDNNSFLDSLERNFFFDKAIYIKLKNNFGSKQEFGLINRLDNDTWWLLFFAKTKEVFELYKNLQQALLVSKIYIADVQWNPFFKVKNKIMNIDYPIMHHKFKDNKMICILSEKDIVLWRGQQHMVQTEIELLDYDKIKNISILQVKIKKWIRHQIRIHLKSIGSPILGDRIYNKNSKCNWLHLWSVWMEI
jgi:23S rRNA-/tRNA-specific pseudouridylate synthase